MFSPKYLGLPVLTKYFGKNICFCPEEDLNFHHFTLTLGHFYTYNTWKFTKKKNFHKVVDMVNIFHLQPYSPPITVLGAELFVFPFKFILAELQLKRFWAWAETKTGLCWGRKTAKVSDEFQTNWIFNKERTKQKHQFYHVGHTIKVMFVFCVFSIKVPIS